MPTIYDCIPERVRKEAEMQLIALAAKRAEQVQHEVERLHEMYGDYSETEFADHLSQVHLAQMQACSDEEASAWVPLFLKHAPDHLNDLQRALMTTPPCAMELKPWHLRELKDHKVQFFQQLVSECRAPKPVEQKANRNVAAGA